MNKFVLFLFAAIIWSGVSAQTDEIVNENILYNKGVIYKFEKYFNIVAHTNGYAAGYNWGTIPGYQKTNYYTAGIGRLTDPRESSQNRNLAIRFNSLSKSFKFGKRNDVFVARLGKGQKKFISDKAKRKGVSVGYDLMGGAALGLAKPYYLDIIYVENSGGETRIDLKSEKYSPENADKFLNFNSIYGRSSWSNGLKEIGFYPGIQGKAGLFFSIGAYDNIIKIVETGIMADVFVRKVPLMVETDAISNKPYFINLYVNLQFGKRSN